jgi:hypothetical protein
MFEYSYNISGDYEHFENVADTPKQPPNKIGEYNFVGCFTDKRKRALNTKIPGAYNMESCVAAAQEKNFNIVGLQNNNQCWAGSSFDKSKYPSKLLTNPTCNYKSPGKWTNIVYENYNLPPQKQEKQETRETQEKQEKQETQEKLKQRVYLDIDNGQLCFLDKTKQNNCINGDYLKNLEARLEDLESKKIPQLITQPLINEPPEIKQSIVD